MSIGCSIYFTPTDSSWMATPDFIRGITSFLGLDTFDSVRVYREAPSTSESKPHPELESEKVLERHNSARGRPASFDLSRLPARTARQFPNVLTLRR